MTETLTREATTLGAALARAYPWFEDAGIELATWADPYGLGVVVSARCGDYEARGRVRPRGPAPFDARRALRWVHRWLRAAFLTPLRRYRTLRPMARTTARASTQIDPSRVFIAWSGDVSKTVATALYHWLPNVIQVLKPWMSHEGVPAGGRWSGEIASALDASQVGVVCVTRENKLDPWILFETGALAKNVGIARVCPYMIGSIRISDLHGALTQFQAKAADRLGTFDVLRTINDGLGEAALPAERLNSNFDLWWPSLEATLAALPPPAPHVPRDPNEMLAEILETVRGMSIPPDLSYEIDDLTARVNVIENGMDGPSVFGGRIR